MPNPGMRGPFENAQKPLNPGNTKKVTKQNPPPRVAPPPPENTKEILRKYENGDFGPFWQGKGCPKGVFLESPFSSMPPEGLPLKNLRKKPLELIKNMLLSIFASWTTVSLHDAFSAPLPHSLSSERRRLWLGYTLGPAKTYKLGLS